MSVFWTITSPTRGMLTLSKFLTLRPTLSPGPANSTVLWCISTEKILPEQFLEAVWVGRKMHSSPGDTLPCSTRPVITSPTPLILYTPETGIRRGFLRARLGGLTIFSRQSKRVSQWTGFFCDFTSAPDHQPMLEDFSSKLSPIQPEIGIKGTQFLTNSFFHPTFTSIEAISSLISL